MAEQFDEQGRPTRVKVLAVDYTVTWADIAWFRATEDFGQIDPTIARITIYEECSPHQQADTFLHEVTHALVNQSIWPKKDFTSEEIAMLIGSSLTAFWRDNPQTLAWWTALIQG